MNLKSKGAYIAFPVIILAAYLWGGNEILGWVAPGERTQLILGYVGLVLFTFVLYFVIRWILERR